MEDFNNLQIFQPVTAQVGNVDWPSLLWLVEMSVECWNFHFTILQQYNGTTEEKLNGLGFRMVCIASSVRDVTGNRGHSISHMPFFGMVCCDRSCHQGSIGWAQIQLAAGINFWLNHLSHQLLIESLIPNWHGHKSYFVVWEKGYFYLVESLFTFYFFFLSILLLNCQIRLNENYL